MQKAKGKMQKAKGKMQNMCFLELFAVCMSPFAFLASAF
jgi:hypothetical protein